LIRKAKDGLKKDQAPPTMVASEFPETFDDPRTESVGWMCEAFRGCYEHVFFLHQKVHVRR
jgi:hypothetical protein